MLNFMTRLWSNGALTTLLVILLATPLSIQGTVASANLRQVTRLNYGVLFTPVRSVKLMTDIWSHIFDLHLPSAPSTNLRYNDLPQCDMENQSEKSTCELNKALVLKLQQQHIDMTHQIADALRHIYHLLPMDKNISRPFSRKRSLLPIGGVLLSQLFGTTSEEDLKPIKDHIKRIAKGVSFLGEGLQMQQNQLTSFIETSAERMDAFRNLSMLQERTITEFDAELRVMHETETQNQQRLILAIKRMQDYVNYLRHIDELRQSIEFLIQGILTPQLMPKSTLQSNLQYIRSYLRDNFPNCHLIFDRACDFYAMRNFQFGRHDSRLLIQLQVPISTFVHDFVIYKMTSFPVPVTGRQSHITSISNLPQFFVSSPKSPYYFTMDQDDTSYHHKLLSLRNKDITFSHYETTQSCASALFRNDIALIKRTCSFSLREQSLVPNILPLERGKILLTNISQLVLTCNSVDSIMEGCVQCIKELPCKCEMKIFLQNTSRPSFYWPPKLLDCRPSANISKTRHIVNLASLQSFFQDDSLGGLSGNTYLPASLPVELPPFKQYRHKFQQFVSEDNLRSHNLHKFSQKVKNRSLIFNELSEVMLHHMNDFPDSSVLLTSPQVSNVSWWLTWSSIICSYASLLMVLYLFHKFRIFGSLLALFKTSSALQPTIFPSFLSFGRKPWTDNPTTTINYTHSVQTLQLDNSAIIDLTTVLTLAFMTILFLLLWIYKNASAKQNVYVVLEIGNLKTSIRVRCMCLKSAIYAYQFHAQNYISSLSTAAAGPYLVVKWPEFLITHIMNDVALTFPSKVLIGPWSKFKIKTILQGKTFYVLSLLEFNGNFRLIDFESPIQARNEALFVRENDEQIELQEVSHEKAVSVETPLKLYPSMVRLPDIDEAN